MDLSASSLLASMFVSTIGLGFFLYGKKSARFPQMIAGMTLMGFPYFVSGEFLLWGIGALTLVAAVWALIHMGRKLPYR